MLSELGRDGGRTARGGEPCRAIERRRDVGVGAACGERQIAGVLLSLGDLAQPSVQGAPIRRSKTPGDTRGQEWVGETDALTIQLEHAGCERVAEPLAVGERLDQLRRRLRQRRDDLHDGVCRGSQCVETLPDEPVQRARQRQVFTGPDPAASPDQGVPSSSA